MLACIQRVSEARVTVDGEVCGSIGRGLLVLLGVSGEDTETDARWLADKVVGLRIFPDDAGQMNLSIEQCGGAVLVVSQFTLLGDCRKGRRPSFIAAAAPEKAEALYERFMEMIAERGIETATGRFRAHMDVALVNDGPVTLMIDSRDRHAPRRG
jgi:D-tyrosyl-tRNA(Tyr) deacylase